MLRGKPAVNQGDDIAGYVHQAGEHVYEFRPGDRVIAFHEMMKPGGSYAAYAVSEAHTTTIHCWSALVLDEETLFNASATTIDQVR